MTRWADTLDGGSGNDSMSGGIGNDAYLIDNTLDVVAELAAQGRDRVSATISYTLLANFEDLTLLGTIGNSGTGNVLDNEIIGNTGGNSLSGLDGNDSMDGAGGNDTLNGGLGRDTMTGGTGNDLFIVDNASDVVIEAALGGTDTVQTALNHTLASEVENLILTGTANLNGTGNSLSNSLTGTDGTNLLSGLDGNDSLYGGAGNDTLDGGTGNDSLTGGLGDDLYYIDSATDKITETSTGGVDTVSTALTHTLVSYLENLILTGNAAVNGTGNSSANVLTGNSGDNVLAGGSGGNDTLDGGNGTDNLQGGAGNDYYIVDTAFDVLTEAAGQGTDTVQSNVGLTLGDNFENLILGGTLTASGTGNVLNNRITGNGAINVLNGMDGDDTLVGGVGNDNLTGGLGADHFAFVVAASGVDVITDFNALNGGPAEGDMLEFTGLLNGTFAYLGSGSFTASGNTQARVTGSQVQLDFDGNGISDLSITLTGLTAASQLTALDFLFN
jgi:Ca2+-binding RTX toxin-like protein